MIKEDYISFETAKLLKEKGFDVPIFQHYTKVGSIWICRDRENFNSEKEIECYSAPTLQMAMKWLREDKKYHIMVDCLGTKNWLPTIQHTVGYNDYKIESKVQKFSGNGFDSYEEAVEAALIYSLTNLI